MFFFVFFFASSKYTQKTKENKKETLIFYIAEKIFVPFAEPRPFPEPRKSLFFIYYGRVVRRPLFGRTL